jgi:membrane-bound metal-dependent hydrolase YbcI (DUF457 family)
MAAFRAHVTTGLTVGYVLGAVVGLNRGVGLETTPILMCLAAFVGSFLPDVDSDSGTPFDIVFNLFAFVGGGIAFWACLQQPGLSPVLLLIIPPATVFGIRYGVGELFQRFTRHRGIFHSLPASLIATLLVPVVLQMFVLPYRDVIAMSLSVGFGYLSHLVLDEIYSTVNFDGKRFRPKKSLGTALSLASPSKQVTLVTYLLLASLVLYNWPLLRRFASP